MVFFNRITTVAVALLGYRVAGVVVCRPATATSSRAYYSPRSIIHQMLPRARDIQALAVVCGASSIDVSRSVVPKHRTGNPVNSLVGVPRSVLRLIFDFLRNPRNINVNAASTLLGFATLEGYLPLVMELLSFQNIDVNKSLECGFTPLTIACINGSLPIVKALFGHGSVDINKRGKYGKTPLIYASRGGNLLVVQALLSCDGIEINKSDDSGGMALTYAWNADVVRELLSCEGIDVNWGDKEGATALYYASRRGNLPVVRELLSYKGIDVNTRLTCGPFGSWTPLMKTSCPDVAKALLAHKDINVYAKTKPYQRRGRKFSGRTAWDIHWDRCEDCVRYDGWAKTREDYLTFSNHLEIFKMLEPFGRSRFDLWGQFRGQPKRPKSLNCFDRPKWYKWYKCVQNKKKWVDLMKPVEPVKSASERFDENLKNMYEFDGFDGMVWERICRQSQMFSQATL